MKTDHPYCLTRDVTEIAMSPAERVVLKAHRGTRASRRDHHESGEKDEYRAGLDNLPPNLERSRLADKFQAIDTRTRAITEIP
jgi:hypothetical protein